ncbi:ubiquitin domain-containing protein 7SL RNA1-like [Papaver somniferum]|uniref:ubiquitin domain-containing protein 7SL RNA1-like n=1 Tax=Papaver somniferum TaxID=3469 RepID=UPI000E6FF1AA|nr:ubiquitin domain-containing protein 7SL RNA1-like [Papaver somniferum]
MDVRIRFSDGKSFPLELWYFDTILEIKKKIRKYLGIPIFRQKLYDSNGRGLRDDRDTEFYNVIQGTTLLLQDINPGHKTRDSDNEDEDDNNYTACSSRTMIRLLIKVELTKRKFKLEMEPSDTVGCLRAKIREYEALPIIRLVLSSGAALGDDNKTLSHYGLVPYSRGNNSICRDHQVNVIIKSLKF